MEYLIQGLGIGLGLTIMVGPITLTIIDSSLAGGWKAGLTTGLAMWFSDLLFILAIYYGGEAIIERITLSNLEAWVSFAAGAILLTIGIVLWLLRNQILDLTQNNPTPGRMIGHAFRGFLVNTFSPFTLLFWPTLIAGTVIGGELNASDSSHFFIGIMVAIIAGDTVKSFFADWIRKRISPNYMKYTRIVIALIFAGGGIFMLYRGFTSL